MKVMPDGLIPLFPLSLVLLPFAPLPLHIFEERYKQMMSDIIPKRGEFGVVLVKGEGLVNIGCTAVVDRVLERHPDGRLDVIAFGRRRFRIVALNDELTYLRADVEFFQDEDDDTAPPQLRERTLSAYAKLTEVEPDEELTEPKLDSPLLSFQIAQRVSDLDKRQAVLSIRSETERLRFLLAMLPEYTLQRKRTAEAKRLSPQNGHAKHIHSSNG